MKQIKPSEISGKILSLLDESDERVIIVSPYVKISKWYKLVKKLLALKTRGIPVEIYVRDGPENAATFHDLDSLALPYKKIPHLHSKFYLNEKCGIVTSMNLLLSSEINSQEIGYETESWTEYNELIAFHFRYIRKSEAISSGPKEEAPQAELKAFIEGLREELCGKIKNPRLLIVENVLKINAGLNNYWISISEGKLRITARLRMDYGVKKKSKQSPELICKKVKDLTAMKVAVLPGSKSDCIQVSGVAHRKLASPSIAGVLEAEASYILRAVQKFINAAESLGG